jgi:transcriptional regulator with XRE-family HTH domain
VPFVAGQRNPIAQVIGRNLADLREAKGFTQTELAARMTGEGFQWRARQKVIAAEQGEHEFTVPEVDALGRILGITPQTLLAVRKADNTSVLVGQSLSTGTEWEERWGVGEDDRAALVYGTEFFAPQRRAKRAGAIAEMRQRERELARRTKLAGPTFVADKRVRVKVPIPKWNAETEIILKPGVPYVARDLIERRALQHEEEAGNVRTITRHQARRLRPEGGTA